MERARKGKRPLLGLMINQNQRDRGVSVKDGSWKWMGLEDFQMEGGKGWEGKGREEKRREEEKGC